MSAFFPETKNGLPRTVPLRQHVIELLQRLPRTDDRVFPISVYTLKKAWNRICERAGLVDETVHDNGNVTFKVNFHIHDLRHEAISRIAEVGYESGRPFDVVTLAAITGHRDLRMLARYARMCSGEIARRLDEAFELAKQNKTWRKGRPAPRMGPDGDTPHLKRPEPADTDVRRPQLHSGPSSAADSTPLGGNVIPFKRRRY